MLARYMTIIEIIIKVQKVEIDFLRTDTKVWKVDSVRNDKVKELTVMKKGLDRVKDVLRWYEYVERMDLDID